MTGTVTLTATDSNDVSGTQTVTLATDTGILTGVKLSLGAVGTVTGTVYDASGNLVNNTELDVQSSGNGGGFDTEVYTDTNGNFIATDIPVGNITVYVTLPDGTSKSGKGTLVNNGDTVIINIGAPTAALGVVFGTVYDTSGNPAPGAVVTVTESAASQTASATTDGNGLYSINGFSAGTVVASATLSDGSTPDPVTGTITDVTVPIEVDLGITDNGNVSGVVNDSDGNPVGGVNVNVASSGDTSTSYGQTSGDDGSFYFSGIAPGAITITVTDGSGNQLGTAMGSLPFGGNLTLNVNFPAGNAHPHHALLAPPPMLLRGNPAPSPFSALSPALRYTSSQNTHRPAQVASTQSRLINPMPIPFLPSASSLSASSLSASSTTASTRFTVGGAF